MVTQFQWPVMQKCQLPQDMIALPTIEAEPWLLLDPDVFLAGLEGPAFDREGNFYVCHKAPFPNSPEGVVFKISKTKKISVFWRCGSTNPVGIAIHRDGRFFLACMTGELVILSPDGKLLCAEKQYYNNELLCLNDLTFDLQGRLYFTNFQGNRNRPCGGIFRLDPENNYHHPTLICGNLLSPNGISFSPDYRRLWIGESCGNTITKLELESDGTLSSFLPTLSVYRNTGGGILDSNKVDADGNIYQAIMGDGRIAVLNNEGVAIGNVVAPGRQTGQNQMGPNMAIKPDTCEAYWVIAGTEGSWVFRFPTLAPGAPLFGFT